MRKLVLFLHLIALLAGAGCDSTGGDSLEGTYTLIRILDDPLPILSNVNFVPGQGVISIGCITDGSLRLKGKTYRIVLEESEYSGSNCGESYIGEGRDLVESGSYEVSADKIVLLPENQFDFGDDSREGEIVGGLISFRAFTFQKR